MREIEEKSNTQANNKIKVAILFLIIIVIIIGIGLYIGNERFQNFF